MLPGSLFRSSVVLLLGLATVAAISEKHALDQLVNDIERGAERIASLNPFAERKNMWFEQVSKHPRAFYFHNFLSNEERTHMIRLAAPMMKRSTVVGEHGESVVDDIRTSHGMFIRRLEDPVIERIEKRISLATMVPMQHQEDIQVLRYTKGQSYGAHWDSAYDNDKDEGPHFRLATFLMYLSDVEEGGETAFPDASSEWMTPELAARAAKAELSECAKGHVAAKPKAGDAVLFYSYHPNKTMDKASLHTGCPVIKGIKWAAPVWIHVDEFEPEDFQRRSRGHEVPHEPGMCEDLEMDCAKWAAAGECERNRPYMTGIGSTVPGVCPKSCKACSQCKADDWACIRSNRKKLGFLDVERGEMEALSVPWWYEPDPTPEL